MDRNEKQKKSWRERIVKTTRWCLLPLRLVERVCEGLSNLLGRWAFLEIMEHLGRLAILVAVIFWFAERDERRKAKHYQAWQVINSAHGHKSSGGRIDALQDLANDKVSLAGIDISKTILPKINLRNAILSYANLSGANLLGADLSGAKLSGANLSGANLLGADLSGAKLSGANLSGANLWLADLHGANLSGANLLQVKQWGGIKSIKLANIYAVRNPPEGFIEWAKENGAVEFENEEEWENMLRNKD